MGIKCGIVGLPNVGKSTLFNAVTQTVAADVANYPFCTIDPNEALVSVPDERLFRLAEIAGSAKIIPTQIEFVDIAGLVKNASKGEGLGNQFLSHIREAHAIIHVLRCFEDSDIAHVEGKIDPVRDLELIKTELILSDLESVEKRLPNLEKKARNKDREFERVLENLKLAQEYLNRGEMASLAIPHAKDAKEFMSLNLITAKPSFYVCNVGEEDVLNGNEHSKRIFELAKKENVQALLISTKIEAEIAGLESEEMKKEFLQDLGLKETGLNQIIKTGYHLLDLQTFFTIGPKEARAWTVKKGAKAPAAAGEIHSDFERGFIRAETISYDDYVACKGEQGAKDAGKLRVEGKDYVVADGDVMHFRFNV